MRVLYNVIFRAAMPLILLRLWWRGRSQPEYRLRLAERLGKVPKRLSSAPLLWVHSVSVGETLAAIPVITQLAARYPQWQWLVTTSTPTGSERVTEALRPILGGRLLHYYLPYDLPECLTPFLQALRPNMLVIVETELWPNLLHFCRKRNIPTLLANARLSEKSARGYGKFPRFTQSMLANLDKVVAQYDVDAQRFVKLGLPAPRVLASGNIKFDLDIGLGLVSEAQALAHQWRGPEGRKVWLAASTHTGEDEIILDAYRALLKTSENLLLVLVPRHPQRFASVARLCQERGFQVVRRSEGRVPSVCDQILLGDTMGELLSFFGASDMAFVGGSLVPVGGHNMIEPAAWGIPVVCGPFLHNFSTVAQLLKDAGGMVIVKDAASIAEQLGLWLKNDRQRMAAGQNARVVAQENSGALRRLLDEIEILMPDLEDQ
ncbi:lipid IV(A) 3-deoxy-D-manno-octulosonic acid transferase [Microbulbifer sp. TRSA005]|uniref:lipid IV(A) 3-deoxy-D-manno-octulosonic acid transferase n=1 Tax=unclassified Microbulbifer TaxID=2619833 RepID=UPI004039275D